MAIPARGNLTFAYDGSLHMSNHMDWNDHQKCDPGSSLILPIVMWFNVLTIILGVMLLGILILGFNRLVLQMGIRSAY